MIISGEKLQIFNSKNSIAFSAGKIGQNKNSYITGENNSFFQIFNILDKSNLNNKELETYIAGKNNFAIGVGNGGGTEKLKTSKNTKNSTILSIFDPGNSETLVNIGILGTVSNSAIIGSVNFQICYTGVIKGINIPTSQITTNSVTVGAKSSTFINVHNSILLGGKWNRIEVACDSVIVGGYLNRIDGFTISNTTKDTSQCIAKRSVILGGNNHKVTKKGIIDGTIIIGGTSSNSLASDGACGDKVFLPNLDSCDKFSVYSAKFSTKFDGITSKTGTTVTLLNSITVCNGIVIAIDPP
jgi:hypothetical protein